MNDHHVCQAVCRNKEVQLFSDLQRAWERGLIELNPKLTQKGAALLDGIEPSACSGWHLGGAPAAADWKAVRRSRRVRSQA